MEFLPIGKRSVPLRSLVRFHVGREPELAFRLGSMSCQEASRESIRRGTNPGQARIPWGSAREEGRQILQRPRVADHDHPLPSPDLGVSQTDLPLAVAQHPADDHLAGEKRLEL